MTQINFTSIINVALLKANNRDNLKSYLIRQSKIANRDAFYELEDFSKELIKVATGKMQDIEFVSHTWKSRLQNRINNIDYEYFSEPPSPHRRTIDEITEIQKIEREKHLKKWKLELENWTINDFGYRKNEYGRLEIIIDVVNEINNKENVSDEDKRAIIKEYTFSESEDKNNIVENDEPKPKITANHHALAYIFDCDAKGQKTKGGRKKELEQIGRARSDNKIDGNTFYKAFNEVMKVDRNKERELTYIAGEDWKNIIIRLSKDADKLDKYLKTKDL